MKTPAPDRRAMIAVAALAITFLALPLVGLLQRTPWSRLFDLLGSETVVDAIGVSVMVSLIATAVSVVLGFPLAFLLARREFKGRALVRTIVMLPMVLPPVVGGTALLFALGRRGFAGQWLDKWFDISLPFTTAGAVIAATFVAMPFFVISVESGLRQAGTESEEAAATLGATPTTVLRHITVPQIRGALAAGAALTWARALGEFGATVTFAGNLPGETQTLPLATFVALESRPDEALVLAVLLLTVAFAVLFLLRGRLINP